MFKRQKIILQLLSHAGGILSRTRLFKLSFLLSKEGKANCLQTFYDFVPYLYGPYSFALNHELDNLAFSNMVNLGEDGKISLTALGRETISDFHEEGVYEDLELLKKYSKLNQKALVQAVYEQYPWFTINSSQSLIENKKWKNTECKNYTIGYQIYQIDSLLNFLLEQGIKQLIDTRRNPVSRRYGFHKGTLLKLCQKVGINYIHIPQLGVPSAWRQELTNEESFNVLFRRYESEILDSQMPLLKELAKNMNIQPSALMCQEQEHNECHRSKLAEKLSKLNGLSICELNNLYVRTI